MRSTLCLLLLAPLAHAAVGGYVYEDAAPPPTREAGRPRSSASSKATLPGVHAVMGEAFALAKQTGAKPLLYGILFNWDGSSGGAEARIIFYDPSQRRRIALEYRGGSAGLSLKSREVRALARSGRLWVVKRTLQMSSGRGLLGAPAEDSAAAEDGSIAECAPIDVQFLDSSRLPRGPAGDLTALLFNPAGRSCDENLAFFNAKPKGSWRTAIRSVQDGLASQLPSELLGRSLWAVQEGKERPYYLDAQTGQDLGRGRTLSESLQALPKARTIIEPAQAASP